MKLSGISSLVLAAALSACGGSGDDSASSATGSVDNPHPFDEPIALSTDVLQTKGVADWEVAISQPVAEATQTSEGDIMVVRFSARAVLTGSEQVPVTTRESFAFEILGGATSTVVAWPGEGCEAGDNFDEGLLLDTGEEVIGDVCVSIAVDDFDHPDTLVAVTFNLDEAIYFGTGNDAAPA